jgi:hypothetical protein
MDSGDLMIAIALLGAGLSLLSLRADYIALRNYRAGERKKYSESQRANGTRIADLPDVGATSRTMSKRASVDSENSLMHSFLGHSCSNMISS